MEKVIIIRGKATEVNKIVQENRIRKELGLISIEDESPKSSEKRDIPDKKEKLFPEAYSKNI